MIPTTKNNLFAGGPPPPPAKKKNRQVIPMSPAVGAGFNFASSQSMAKRISTSAPTQIDGPCASVYDIVPDTTIGHGVEVNGDMEFSRLLRIDGKFKGTLTVSLSESSPPTFVENVGNLIIGEHGVLVGDVGDSCNIRCMVMEGGEVIGNISVEELVMLNNAKVTGKITSKFCTIGPNATVLTGNDSVNIHRRAPEVIDQVENSLFDESDSFSSGKDSLSASPAAKSHQRKNYLLEKKKRRENFPDPMQPLFEVPKDAPLPPFPAKFSELWPRQKKDRDKPTSRPTSKITERNNSQISAVEKTTDDTEHSIPPTTEAASSNFDDLDKGKNDLEPPAEQIFGAENLTDDLKAEFSPSEAMPIGSAAGENEVESERLAEPEQIDKFTAEDDEGDKEESNLRELEDMEKVAEEATKETTLTNSADGEVTSDEREKSDELASDEALTDHAVESGQQKDQAEHISIPNEEVHYNIRLSKVVVKLEEPLQGQSAVKAVVSFPRSSWSGETTFLDPAALPQGMRELLEWDCSHQAGMEFSASSGEVSQEPLQLSLCHCPVPVNDALTEDWTELALGSIKLAERISISSGSGEGVSPVHELRFPLMGTEPDKQLGVASILFSMNAIYVAAKDVLK